MYSTLYVGICIARVNIILKNMQLKVYVERNSVKVNYDRTNHHNTLLTFENERFLCK